MVDIAEYRRHKNSWAFLISIAGLSLLFSLLSISIPNYQWAILLAIIALVFGHFAFDHLEKSAQFKPIADIVHQLPLFESTLKNGNIVRVTLELHYPSAQDSPLANHRIKIQLQRTLNVYLSKTDALSEDPYPEVDDLLQKEMEPLRRELGLDRVFLKTVHVQTLSPPKQPGTNGIYLGQV